MTVASSDAPVRLSLVDESAGSFDVTVFPAAGPSRVVLFAVGSGGNPLRHRPLLAASGCAVVATHFDRLAGPEIPGRDLVRLARRLVLALEAAGHPGLPVAGVGHSIGCALLLALAGGQVWTRGGQQLPITPCPDIDRLMLLSPATGFFQAPGALDGVRTPILAWVGAQDDLTPPPQTQYLKQTLEPRVPVDARIVEHAGHFSFMNELPPGVPDPLPDREAFLADMAEEVMRFVNGPPTADLS